MVRAPSRAELEAAHCWEADDRVPRDPAMTAFRRAVRYHQAQWREARGHPTGTQPIAPRAGDDRVRLVGSRMPLDYARATGANFMTPASRRAATERTARVEPHQTFDHQRVWADLLSSQALAFNLFGDLAADHVRANDAVHTWWPDADGSVVDVRFAHSPGRLDSSYLANLRVFDTAFVLESDDGARGVIAIDTKYHERAKPETPRPENVPRYIEVADRSRMFRPRAIDDLRRRSDLAEVWLEHLLLHSMLQHPNAGWSWGRYVVIYPTGNTHIADACVRYATLLSDRSTFNTATVEELLDARALRRSTQAALRSRYLPA